MNFLTGEYDHQIDAKNRIRIPTKLIGNEERLYFSRGANHCIAVYFEDVVNKMLEEVNDIRKFDLEKQKAVRDFARSIRLVEADGYGRMVIPPELVSFANIKKEIKICGAVSRIEIWAKEVYDEYFADSDENYDKNLENLGI